MCSDDCLLEEATAEAMFLQEVQVEHLSERWNVQLPDDHWPSVLFRGRGMGDARWLGDDDVDDSHVQKGVDGVFQSTQPCWNAGCTVSQSA